MKKLLAMLLALVMALSMLTVAAFAQSTEDGDTIVEDGNNEEPTVDDPVEDTNPPTGIVLSVVPMIVAGAAVAFSKKH